MSLKEEEAYCPNNCEGGVFYAAAHVTESWALDCHGNWLETYSGADEVVIHHPNKEDLWECSRCGETAKFRNV